VKGGFTKAEALMAATRINAEIIDMEDKIGSIKPGMLADLIVVDGKPDQDLDDLRKVETVIKDGFVVVDRGQIFTPRHVPVPLANPTPPKTQSSN
jgi:imidazolonepropionase-like amidohydrolase